VNGTTRLLVFLVALASGSARAANADVATLNPVADAFVAQSHPDSNFGGAGALAVAAPGLSRGEFQSVLQHRVRPGPVDHSINYAAPHRNPARQPTL
jgi:hypothetical protein